MRYLPRLETRQFADWANQGILYLTAGLLFGAATLRSLVSYRGSPVLGDALRLLSAWLLLFALEALASARWSRRRIPRFYAYLVLQSALVFALLSLPGSADFYATLFGILSMQVAARLDLRAGSVWIALSALVMVAPLVQSYGLVEGISFVFIYTAVNALVAWYSLATRRAVAARTRNQELAEELREANRQLQAYSAQVQELAAAREGHRIARELHDSVTQTIFSMTLATQSALLLLEREPARVGGMLDELAMLAQGALAEMRTLVSELHPEKKRKGDLAAALRRHLAECHLPESLVVSLRVEGSESLSGAEERTLFRIAQEALNNIVKHAHASQACITLHLTEPCWMEIQDAGIGFDAAQAQSPERVGLASMRERAAEIGWRMQLTTSPGAGTRIRVERRVEREES